MAAFETLDELGDGKRVLARVDLNSPVEDGEIQDNRRFRRHAETLQELISRDCSTVVLAHQGRPGQPEFVSLEQHADILADHVGQPIEFVPDTAGADAEAAITDLEQGEILLLENSRMCDGELPEESPESKAETAFVETLFPLFDAYVNDAYSVAHRSHASIVGFPERLPAYAGRVMEAEYEANTAIGNRTFDGDVTMVVGGTKATDVIDVMAALGDSVDTFLLGGIAGELFLRAAGHSVGTDVDGTSHFDEQWERNKETIEEALAEFGEKIQLPVDLAYEGDDGDRAEVAVEDVGEKTTAFLDVGSETVMRYSPTIRNSEAVFVKGALGLFEDERFSVGTVGALEAIADTDCFSVVGGGDTSRAIELYGLSEESYGHVTIAGGAYIRALTGEELPGVTALIQA
jgi:phosphoglycerate kinase